MITRRDLPIGHQACQAVHAAFEFAVAYPRLTEEWVEESNYLAVLATEDENSLAQLANDIRKLGVCYIKVIEPDFGDELTAVAVEPSDDVRRLLSSLPLLGKGGGGTT